MTTKAKDTPAEAPTETTADPFASLTAEPTDNLFTTGGRPGKPIPESVTKLVVQSYNGGESKALRVELPTEAAVKDFRRYLGKAGERHDPPLTVRSTVETDNKLAVRFKAGAKITRATAPATAPAEGTPAETSAEGSTTNAA
jgi:hypothetical protein